MFFIKKLFKKKEYNIKSIEMSEEIKENIYVWHKSERIGKIVVEKETKKEKEVKKSEMNDFDPDEIMVNVLEKLSKKNRTKFDISLNVSIPSKTIVKALELDVEEDELRRGLVKLVKKQINNIYFV